jgi:hypothetical protein
MPSLVASDGSVFACHLVVGPSVELLCWSTPGPEIPINTAQNTKESPPNITTEEQESIKEENKVLNCMK